MKATRYILLMGLLLCVLRVVAQSPLHFPQPEWDFGSIPEEGGPVLHRFELVNEGGAPAVIAEVGVSCGCTKVTYSRKPLRPGEKSVVEVLFNPLGQQGAIDRQLPVYDQERRVAARLRVKGRVVPRERTVTERFPVDVGAGIRLSNNYLPFDYLPHGEEVRAAVGVVNASDRPHTLRFVPQERESLLAVTAPGRLEPGEEAEVVLRYRIPAGSPLYGTVSDTYEIEVDGRRRTALLTARGVVVDGADALSDEGTPRAYVSPGIVRLGEVKRSGGPRSVSFELQNRGSAPFAVRTVELPEGVSCTLKPGMQVAAGGSLTVGVTLDPRRFDFGTVTERMLLVVSDPEHPVQRLRITAIVVD